MRTFADQCAQGDMLITRIKAIPRNAKKQDPESNGDHIVTHSETGHHHVVAGRGVERYIAANDPMISFLHVKEPTKLRHLRDFDTHEEIELPVGNFEIRRQREWTPEEQRMVAD